MNDQMPVGNHPQPEFKETALNQEFKFTLSRKQCIILANVLRPIQLPISDLRSKVLREILEDIEKKAIQSIKKNDYEDVTSPLTDTTEVTVA